MEIEFTKLNVKWFYVHLGFGSHFEFSSLATWFLSFYSIRIKIEMDSNLFEKNWNIQIVNLKSMINIMICPPF
jgi:hypothetical protein